MTETTTTIAREVQLVAGAAVEIALTSQNIRVRGVDGNRVAVRARGGEDIDDEVVVEATPTLVRIGDNPASTRFGPFRFRVRGPADLDIDVPRGPRLTLRTVSGDVEASGIGGESRWASASGNLRVEVDAGPVSLESMSGDVVLAATAAIDARARSVSGDVTLRAPRFDSLDASTTSGDVRVTAALGAGREHVISSVSGDVELTTSSDVRADTASIAGDVRVTGPHRSEGARGRRTLVFGSGAIGVSIRTTSGDIRLQNAPAGDASVSAPVARTPPIVPTPPIAPTPPVPPAVSTDAGAIVVVAEETAAPNLVRPPAPDAAKVSPEPDAPLGSAGSGDRREAARLEILRALERGDLDVDSASHELEVLEDAGPRSFRGWC